MSYSSNYENSDWPSVTGGGRPPSGVVWRLDVVLPLSTFLVVYIPGGTQEFHIKSTPGEGDLRVFRDMTDLASGQFELVPDGEQVSGRADFSLLRIMPASGNPTVSIVLVRNASATGAVTYIFES